MPEKGKYNEVNNKVRKKYETIRSTEDYQYAYSMIDAIEERGCLDYNKMLIVCKYVYPRAYFNVYIRHLNINELIEEYLKCKDVVKHPFICLTRTSHDVFCDCRTSMLDEAFSIAADRWRTVTDNYKHEDDKPIYTVAEMLINEPYNENCTFEKDCDLGAIAEILRMQYLIDRTIDSHWLEKLCIYAKEKDPGFYPGIRKPFDRYVDEKAEMRTLKRAEEILGISITE